MVSSLERYFYLITFNAYLSECVNSSTKFSEWMKSRPEIRAIVDGFISSPTKCLEVYEVDVKDAFAVIRSRTGDGTLC